MSILKPAFIRQARSSLPSGGTRLIHEDPAQLIQGGASNDHYHLTAKQLEFLSRIWEPVIDDNTGQLVTAPSGDIIMGWSGAYVPT